MLSEYEPPLKSSPDPDRRNMSMTVGGGEYWNSDAEQRLYRTNMYAKGESSQNASVKAVRPVQDFPAQPEHIPLVLARDAYPAFDAVMCRMRPNSR